MVPPGAIPISLLMELCGDGLLQMWRFVALLRNNMVRRVSGHWFWDSTTRVSFNSLGNKVIEKRLAMLI